ncbi:hypothetical protein TanjilG_07647 [Lupinus angustifolius]|uniref:Uncharacterized protein n=1 Tax=Lupinus angustifolius TaxID=3871 RepID=A0A1J7GUH8_LUPAN|nr:hypothetical protein TanjilG_07647 [Lupinus angustifolius]
MNSQSELLADQQEICIGADDQDNLSLEQAVGGLAVNGMHCSSHEQQSTSAGTPGSVSVDKICEENILLFMRCEEYRKRDIELKQTVEELEEELKEVQMKCTHLSSLLEAKRKHKNVKGQ